MREKTPPQTLDGWIITTREPEGALGGEDLGRLWFKTPGRYHDWTWYGGFASEARRQAVLAKAQTMTFQEFDAWWDTDRK